MSIARTSGGSNRKIGADDVVGDTKSSVDNVEHTRAAVANGVDGGEADVGGSSFLDVGGQNEIDMCCINAYPLETKGLNTLTGQRQNCAAGKVVSNYRSMDDEELATSSRCHSALKRNLHSVFGSCGGR